MLIWKSREGAQDIAATLCERRHIDKPLDVCVDVTGNAPVSDYPAGEQYDSEQRSSDLCDSGLPDTEVCDVLHIPPREMEVVSEAWSRG